MNNLTFNDENFLQVKGTAMGTRAAPNFANVYPGRFEQEFVYESEWSKFLLDWVRFIDDIFLVWIGNKETPMKLIKCLNAAVPSIKFTHEISRTEVNFLDTTVRKNEEGVVSIDVYQKPTDTHPYLHWTSAHPPHLKHSIPYSQALRLRRICSSSTTLTKRIREYSEFFVACGYNRNKVHNDMHKVLSLSQEECLQTKQKKSTDRIPFVTTYNPHTTYIAEIAHRNWTFLQSKERMARVFNKRPLVAYRRPMILRDKLVNTKFRIKRDQPSAEDGCKPCNKHRCSWCQSLCITNTFTGTRSNREFKILHSLNCQSSWGIYVIKCQKCDLQYIGKSESNFNFRLNNHRNHIRAEVNSCELTEHFLQNKRSHSFERDVRITVIEQIRKRTMPIEQKKELLRTREKFWQTKQGSIQPKGLNRRTG